VAVHDTHPAASVHLLVIPEVYLESPVKTGVASESVLGRMRPAEARFASDQGRGAGLRTIINAGRVGEQGVYHLHLHIPGGARPLPPMLKY
jgi:histidine triad (HIT) family protein